MSEDNSQEAFKIDYFKAAPSYGYYNCEFRITIPNENIEEMILNAKKWADNTIEREKTSKVYFEEIKKADGIVYTLFIQGKGEDARCTWCRSLRNNWVNRLTEKKIPILREVRSGAFPFRDCYR